MSKHKIDNFNFNCIFLIVNLIKDIRLGISITLKTNYTLISNFQEFKKNACAAPTIITIAIHSYTFKNKIH